MKTESKNITLRSLVIGTIFAVAFAIITVYFTSYKNMIVTGNQIAVLPYMILVLMVLVLNPLGRLIRVRRLLSVIEIMIIFIMGSVSSGISTFGLVDQWVPIVGSLFNQEWNTSQSEWNRFVVPFLNENYFVAEPGLRSAADRYRQALESSLKARGVYDTALMRQRALARLAEAEAALKQAAAGPDDDEQKTAKITAATLRVNNARDVGRQTEEQWAAWVARDPGLVVEDVLKTYPARIEAGEQQIDQAKAALDDLEKKAFDKVRVFRRGLSRGLRAYPGIIPMPGDNYHSYGQRLKRAICGRSAVSELDQAQALLAGQPAEAPVTPDQAEAISRRLAAAAQALAPVARTNMYVARQGELARQAEQATARIGELERRLQQLGGDRMKAGRDSAAELDQQAEAMGGELKRWKSIEKEVASDREKVDRQSNIAEKVAGVAAGLEALSVEWRQPKLSVADARARMQEAADVFPTIEGSVWQWLIGDVPWSHWARPVLRWGVLIALTYVILMSLNLLIFRQWAYNEKLTYPLAELPKALIAGEGGIPPIFRNPLFWMGLGLAGFVLGWNVFCRTNIVPGLAPFNLGNSWWGYVTNTPFAALKYVSCPVFFTMIGLSFLIPKNISFSLWFFYIIGLAEVQIMVWGGHGVDHRSFPQDWWYLMHHGTAQGEGALMVFSTVVLYKCRKYILCAFMPALITDLEAEERKELKLASFLFVFCSLGLILILWLSMGANLIYTLLFYLILLVITIGLVRAVTEGGMPSFQCNGGPFHLVRTLFGLDKSWTSASLYAPLMVYYAMLFLDIKTFIAPAMANSLKLRDDFKMSRGLFHLAMILAIALACVAAVVTAIMTCYAIGADAMSSWFYISLPRDSMFDVIRSMSKDAPAASPTLSLWMGVGAAAMTALLYFRQFLFWLPHPIGLIMYINPLMPCFWFSIFLGWVGNVMVTKFGNQETFHRAKGFFIGLIVGELTVVMVSMIVSMIMGIDVTITLNRSPNY